MIKVVEPQVMIEGDLDRVKILKSLEKAGRTCYKSEAHITEDSASKFIRMLVKKGHESVIEHEKITVRFICDRGVTHELVRHRLASYSQESTRYVNYNKTEMEFIKPCFWDEDDVNYKMWYFSMLTSSDYYKKLINNGAKPEEARSVLPNSLKTEIVVTANLRQWRKILQDRTSKFAHPQIRQIMNTLLSQLVVELPEIFEGVL